MDCENVFLNMFTGIKTKSQWERACSKLFSKSLVLQDKNQIYWINRAIWVWKSMLFFKQLDIQFFFSLPPTCIWVAVARIVSVMRLLICDNSRQQDSAVDYLYGTKGRILKHSNRIWTSHMWHGNIIIFFFIWGLFFLTSSNAIWMFKYSQ